MKTIFRKFSNGDVIALFPEVPGDSNPFTCSSYMHVGQHGSASAFPGRDTTPATHEEYSPLLAELKRIGYEIRVVKRFTHADFIKRSVEYGK